MSPKPWPPTGILFIPQVNVSMESHGDDYAGQGKSLTLPSNICGNPTSRDIWEQVGGMDKGVRILHISIFDTSTDLWHAVKSHDMGTQALLPIQRKVWCGFLLPLKPITSARFEPVILQSSGKHINHYMT
jgi:hypothetical protein